MWRRLAAPACHHLPIHPSISLSLSLLSLPLFLARQTDGTARPKQQEDARSRAETLCWTTEAGHQWWLRISDTIGGQRGGSRADPDQGRQGV